MRLVSFYLFLLVLPALSAALEPSSLDITLKLARERGYRTAQVDWKIIEAKARLLSKNQGEGAAIRFVLKALGDGHSFYRPPGKAGYSLPAANTIPQKSVRMLSEVRAPILGVPIIRINGWSGTNPEAIGATESLRKHLVSALSVPRCGVVLDFSGNTGGNMWPMLIGLSPLLTEGVLGYFKDAHGATKTIEKKAGGIFIDGSGHMLNDATAQQPQYPAALIAVAVGQRSSSSGEIVPIMFYGQKNVRIFGQRTSGYATVNSTFKLPNGGAAIITTAITQDRRGKVFDAHLEPETLTDRPLEAATRWISSQCQRGIPDNSFELTPR